MKAFFVLTAVAVLALGNAIASVSGTSGSIPASAAAQSIVSMADQELPFDRYWSKS